MTFQKFVSAAIKSLGLSTGFGPDSTRVRQSFGLEALESRVLLTTLVGGDVFQFTDLNDEVIRVQLVGDITVELVGATFEGGLWLGDLEGEFLRGGRQGEHVGDPDDLRAMDLFQIYVSHAAPGSEIIITGWEIPSNDPPYPIPFSGDVGTLVVSPFQGGETIDLAAPSNSGVAFIGARRESDNKFTAITTGTLQGELENLNGHLNGSIALDDTLTAGIVYAEADDNGVGPQVDRILIGGAVTGRVHITSAIDTFYAGWLLTGNARGQGGVDPQDQHQQNFYVAGDLRNLITRASIGGQHSGDPANPSYYTGFDLYVGGRLGQVQSLEGSFLGHVHVENSNQAPRLDGLWRDIEQYASQRDHAVGFDFWDGRLTHQMFRDSLNSPQYLGTIRQVFGQSEVIAVNGTLSTLAGDTVDYYGVSLLAGQTIAVNADGARVGIFDAEGRLVASDYGTAAGGPFLFTADRPGVYRFAVALEGDFDFIGGSQEGVGGASYTLFIEGVEEIALGAIAASQDVFAPSITVRQGDLGAVMAGRNVVSRGTGLFHVTNGHLRTIQGATIGATIEGLLTAGPILRVPNGSVGLVRSTSDYLVLNLTTPSSLMAIGGDYQVIDSATTLIGHFITNGSIGVIRSGGTFGAEDLAPVITINANNSGKRYIDLIEVGGDLGTLTAGGPQITTNGGNVRYMKVTGQVYQDRFFGGGEPVGINHDPGQSVTFIDDSGASATLRPVGQGASLFTRTYGIRSSGGVVVIDVESTGGLEIIGASNVPSSTFEIGRIVLNGSGVPVVLGNNGQPVLSDDEGNRLTLNIRGNNGMAIDVFDLRGGNFSSIRNQTAGEMVNIQASSIGQLSVTGDLGLARRHTPAMVEGRGPIGGNSSMANMYPFADQRNGVLVTGHVVDITAGGSLGNIIVSGSIARITANGSATPRSANGPFHGIAAPIYAGGNIFRVDIGHGVLPSGTGNLSNAGIYASGRIYLVTGINADIRGNIAASGGIERISLTNGAIIGSVIMSTPTLSFSRDVSQPIIVNNSVDAIDINNGGIIGARIHASNLGDFTVRDHRSFGIVNTLFSVVGNGSMGNVTVDGLGVRGTSFSGGANMGNITLTGRGDLLDVDDMLASVRQSESLTWDPFTGTILSGRTDLHLALGTNLDNTVIDGVTNAGLMAGVRAVGQRELGQVSAWQIASSDLHFANTIAGIQTIDLISDLAVTTGQLRNFRPGADVYGLDMKVSGIIDRIIIRGDLAGNSSIIADGEFGDIRNVRIDGDLVGDIIATGRIGNVIIGGDLTGNIQADMQSELRGSSNALNSLRLGGSLDEGSLNIAGDIGRIQIAGDFGDIGQQLNVTGGIANLQVGGALNLDINVGGDIRRMQVGGDVVGQINVQGDLLNANIRGGNWIGDLLVTGGIRTLNMRDGDLRNQIIAGGDIGRVNINSGHLTADARVVTMLGDINTINVRGGDLLGEIRTDEGAIRTVSVNGGNFSGELASQVIGTIRMQGDLGSNSLLQVGQVRNLTIRGDVHDQAQLELGIVGNIRINGDLAGSLSALGDARRGLRLNVGGDLAGQVNIEGDAQINVRGQTTADAHVVVHGDLTRLNVRDTMSGAWLVYGSANRVQAAGMEQAVLTTGRHLDQANIRGQVRNSLIQVGVTPGNDDSFAAIGGHAWMATLGRFNADRITGSIIAAAGHIDRVTVRNDVTDSSISSGLAVAGQAIDQLLAGSLAMTSSADRNTIRGHADRTLMRGNIEQVRIASLINSQLTAGVDPADSGDFADPSVVGSVTGGASYIGTIRADADANSVILADAGIQNDRGLTGFATVDRDVTYTIGDLTKNNPLDDSHIEGTATQGNPVTVTVGGHTLTVRLTGPGHVVVYNDPATDDRVDALVVMNTTAESQLILETSNPSMLGIGRILTGDDAALDLLQFNGDLLGDNSQDPDLWLDGGVNRLQLRNLTSDTGWTGHIGSDVQAVSLQNQGGSRLTIGGHVGQTRIHTGSRMAEIIAGSFGQVSLGQSGGYAGLLHAFHHIDAITMAGHFTGLITTPGGIGSYVQQSGDFAGALVIKRDLGQLTLGTGQATADAWINVGGTLGSLTHRGRFAGELFVNSLDSAVLQGDVASGAVLIVKQANSLQLLGEVNGLVQVDRDADQIVMGSVGNTANVQVAGNVGQLSLGSTQAVSHISVLGHVNNLNVSGTHRGLLAVRGHVQQATLGSLQGGFLSIAGDTGRMTVNGLVQNAVIAFGTWLGDDLIYNTDDDLILGGSVGQVQINGNVRDSVITAGVLPSLHHGPGVPVDLRAYIGNAGAGQMADVDSAQAGGIRTSTIDSLTIRGTVTSTNTNAGRISAVVTADGIGSLQVDSGLLFERHYNEPVGLPQVVRAYQHAPNEFRIVFSRLINTASLVQSLVDGDSGTVVITDTDGNLLDGVQIYYTTQNGANGQAQGVLRIVRMDGFEDDIEVTLRSEPDAPSIYGRAGGRSGLRGIAHDGAYVGLEVPFGGTQTHVDARLRGSLLDGHDDGHETGSWTRRLPLTMLDA